MVEREKVDSGECKGKLLLCCLEFFLLIYIYIYVYCIKRNWKILLLSTPNNTLYNSDKEYG